MRVIEGFEHRPTHHCVTGSMLDVYTFHGCAVSEDMLLGLGEGVGAGYFRFMLSRFLRETHAMGCGDDLMSVAEAFHGIAEDWDRIGSM